MSYRLDLLAKGLKSPTANIFLAVTLEGLSHEQAAARFNCSRENITQRMMYVRRKLPRLAVMLSSRGRPKSCFKPQSQIGKHGRSLDTNQPMAA